MWPSPFRRTRVRRSAWLYWLNPLSCSLFFSLTLSLLFILSLFLSVSSAILAKQKPLLDDAHFVQPSGVWSIFSNTVYITTEFPGCMITACIYITVVESKAKEIYSFKAQKLEGFRGYELVCPTYAVEGFFR